MKQGGRVYRLQVGVLQLLLSVSLLLAVTHADLQIVQAAGGSSSSATHAAGSTSSSNSPPPTQSPDIVPPTPGCARGVLVTGDCVVGPADKGGLTFQQYVVKLLDEVIPLIIFIALIMIVLSGLQYMFSSDDAGKKAAKQRITGTLIGIVFYLFIQFLARLITPTISLDTSGTNANPQSNTTTP